MTDEAKKELLGIARYSIRTFFSGEPYPLDKALELKEKYAVLNEHLGAFVTLTELGELRGCVGYIFSEDDLIKTIYNAARQAAFHDTRFSPLRQYEVEVIQIEISVLSEPFKMKSYDEIELGKHGLILNDAGGRALLLPQVPVEHELNRDEFLNALCQKAGIKSSLWKERLLNIDMFTADVFSEETT